ncbi:MAG TPA: LCP family protein [Jatrophihabitans sp.]|nr:LCP family protein [Jatrophihabitans sp.]
MTTPSEARNSGRHRGGRAASHTWRPFAVVGGKVTAALVSVALLLASGYGWYNFHTLNANAHIIDIAGLGAPTPGGTGQAPAPVSGTAQNILIVGIDSRAGLTAAQKRFLKVGQNDQSTSTDTIMLVHVPADGSRATLISIPRDSYVQIPGHPSNKINAAYADGYYYGGAHGAAAQQAAGASTLVATVKKLTGVTIDHYVQVGFAGFVDIVRAIGNIPIDLCKSVDDTHAHNVAIGETGGSGFKMSAGHHDLTPQQALEFVRQRHNIPGPVTDDLGRELRQRYFLSQAFKKILSAGVLFNPVKLHDLINAVDGAFTFDNHNFDLTEFARQMTNLSAGNISGKSIPTEGGAVIGGQDVLKVDPAKVRAFVHQMFYGNPPAGSSSSSSAAPTGSPSAHRHHHHGAKHPRSCVY